jgi:YggT family protein
MISTALQFYWYILVLYVVFSWVPRPPEALTPLIVGVHRLVDTIALPLSRVIPPQGLGAVALDLSILVLLIGTSILQGVFLRLGL